MASLTLNRLTPSPRGFDLLSGSSTRLAAAVQGRQEGCGTGEHDSQIVLVTNSPNRVTSMPNVCMRVCRSQHAGNLFLPFCMFFLPNLGSQVTCGPRGILQEWEAWWLYSHTCSV